MISGDDRWLWAAVAIVAGLVFGVAAGWYARRMLGRQDRWPELRSAAAPASSFLFWLASATGVVIAVGLTSPETLRPIPRDLLDWLPNVLMAGLLVLGGYAVGIGSAAAVGRGLEQATGAAHLGAERVVRWIALGGSIVLALGQLGVRTTVLTVMVGGVVFGVAATAAILGGFGGRDVAAHIAAGRTLRVELQRGDRLIAAGADGKIVELRSATAVLLTKAGRRVVVPYGVLLEAPFEIEPELDDS